MVQRKVHLVCMEFGHHGASVETTRNERRSSFGLIDMTSPFLKGFLNRKN
jgi:hypothetical protein